jgi:hypothetical protein
MISTKIQITEDQLTALNELALKQQVSLDDLIRQGIDNLIRTKPIIYNIDKRQQAFSIAGKFRSGLKDLSKEHDKYLSESLDS